MSARIAWAAIDIGGAVMGAGAVAINIVLLQHLMRSRGTPAVDRKARAMAALLLVDLMLRFGFIVWVGLAILFLGLALNGSPSWWIAIPIALLVYNAGVLALTRRQLRKARGST